MNYHPDNSGYQRGVVLGTVSGVVPFSCFPPSVGGRNSGVQWSYRRARTIFVQRNRLMNQGLCHLMSRSGTTAASLYVIAVEHQTGLASAAAHLASLLFFYFYFSIFSSFLRLPFGRGSPSACSDRACRADTTCSVLGPSRVAALGKENQESRASSLANEGDRRSPLERHFSNPASPSQSIYGMGVMTGR